MCDSVVSAEDRFSLRVSHQWCNVAGVRIAACLVVVLGLVPGLWAQANATDEFARTIRPVLAQNCVPCHNSTNAKGPANFLTAQTAKDVESRRGLFRNVAAQLRNRTMPPGASKLTEQDRLTVATWIDLDLRKTACSGQEFAGSVTARRLNRREYRHTIRDLLGVDLDVSELFPEDGTGGEGFDTDGEVLYAGPLLMERYLQAAQQILEHVIITPPLSKGFNGAEMRPVSAEAKSAVVKTTRRLVPMGEEVDEEISTYSDGAYGFTLSIEHPREAPIPVVLRVDGKDAGSVTFPRYEGPGSTTQARTVRLSRGSHRVSVLAKQAAITIIHVEIAEKHEEPAAEKKALHYRLFGMEPGQTPLEPRKAAAQLLGRVVRQAYRRPVEQADIDLYLKLYDRAAERGDPYEERVKLALKGVLVSPKFLFRIEEANAKPGIHPLRDYEIATRLSYFLWSTMPDAELARLADEGKLQDPKVLTAQVNRMLDDPRSRVFAETFIGQWLGTKDVGFRVVPALNDLQDFYTPDVAADLRQEPVLMFHYMISENRSLIDLLDANYSFLTDRLVKFYQLEGQVKGVGSDFQRVTWPDARRGGVFGLGAVLAMTSHPKETSPVLRGAWVLDNILGATVPPPPPDVPPLDASAKKGEKVTVREKLERHRANPTCATCHNLIDPIGFGLENFDAMGRWRDQDNGHAVDASATMASGEKLNGPVELRRVMVAHKDDFLRTVTGKVLGYAVGRSLQDGDQCTVQRIAQALEKDHYGARTLIREVVLSVAFRNAQPPSGTPQPAISSVRKPVQRREK
jgi:cytochrome c553